MKKMNRILSLIMVVAMILGTVNLGVFAEEGEVAHEHKMIDCPTCEGAGEVAEAVDMTPYEAANAAFRAVVADDPTQSKVENALGYLEEKGLDVEDEFVQSYAQYMVDSADYDQACIDWADWEANGDPFGYVEMFGDLDTFLYYGCGFEGGAACGPSAPVKTAGTAECTDCDGSGKVACDGAFDGGKLTKNADGTGTMTYTCETCGASYTEERTHAEVVEALGNDGHVILGEPIEHKDATCSEAGYDKYVCTVEGCGAEFTVPIAQLKHSIKNHVCENCGALEFTIYGARMGYGYNYNGQESLGETPYSYEGPAFGEDHVLTMENLGLVDDQFGMFGEFVTNYATSKTWQCVGFLPANFNYYVRDCRDLVYTNSEDVGKFKYAESLDVVKEFVTNNGGVLYGEAPENSDFLGRTGIVAVWFVNDVPVNVGGFGEYNLHITPVSAPALEVNSPGISIGVDKDAIELDRDHGSYTVDLVVRIDANAPNDAHVNLVPGLSAASDAINNIAGIQPGGKIFLNIRFDNQSGRTYNYVEGSAFLATFDTPVESDSYVGTGFDGFQIPASSNAESSFVPRRTNNQPLQDLGVGKMIDDETVGEALKRIGYGKDLELTNVEIAQTYLSNYYLDWTNSVRAAKGEAPATSFEDLSAGELAVFTNGDNSVQTLESCQSAAEMLYYFYYARAFTYNGMSIYNHMQQCGTGASELETAIPAALAGTPYELNVAHILGAETNNGYQNTQFGIRVEFDLSAASTPTSSTTSLTVRKVWSGDSEEVRPDSITVQLYRNGAADGDPVELSEGNNWSHTWRGLSRSAEYTVEEIGVPEGYEVSQSQSGTVVTITNTFEFPENPEVDIPDEEPPLAEIPDEEPPLAELPETTPETELPDDEVPLAEVPQTGDSSWIWLAITLVSAAGFIWLTLEKRKTCSDK